MKRDIVFAASDGERIRTTLFGEDNLGTCPVVIFVHGFKGFKDWGFWRYIGEYFADRGFTALTFNFSHNGVGESLTEFDELDRFACNTFSREVRELSELIDAVKSGYFGDIGDQKIGLLGHSRGGGIALAAARLKPEVAALITWSSVSRLDRYSDKLRHEWKKRGYFEVMNQRTKQMMRLNATLLEDIDEHKHDKLNLEIAAGELNRPLLIIHGEQDISVPPSEAQQLYDWSDKSLTELRMIPRTGHTFGIAHPFEGTCEAFDSVLSS
jgi:dienelactone hydrolase